MNTFLTILIIVLVVILAVLIALYFVGRKMEEKQLQQKDAMEAAKQTVSMLILDKKKLKLKDAGLPKLVYEQTPKYLRWAKVPVVKAKVGPKIMTLMADAKVYEILPVKSEVKVSISGIYITELKSVRGGSIPATPKKKGFLSRFKKQ